MSDNIFQEHELYKDIKFERLDIGKNLVKKQEIRYFNDYERFSYYIGAMWLCPVNSNDKKDKRAVIVNPKIDNIDFMAMFLACLKHKKSAENFEQIYRIYFDEKPIPHQDNPVVKELDSLVLAHFIYCLEPLIKKGLKHNFIPQEDNLSTIKGKLLFSQHLKQNVFKNCNHKAYCCFSQYDINCVENRILKKALNISKKNTQTQYKDLVTKLNTCLTIFQNVSDELSLWELNHIRINPIYREYKPAIEIAKLVIRLERFSSGIDKETPPFWIDMPLLFERYVYSLMLDELTNWGKIYFQHPFRCGIPDFLLPDKKLIVDTKYKPQYITNNGLIEDIKQLSSYSRYKKIREKLGYGCSDIAIPCIIIYPFSSSNNRHQFTTEQNKWKESSQYKNFYMVGVPLPKKTHSL